MTEFILIFPHLFFTQMANVEAPFLKQSLNELSNSRISFLSFNMAASSRPIAKIAEGPTCDAQEIQLDADGTISLDALRKKFPDADGLKYQVGRYLYKE